jgi:IclR family mhp operon transcriptional activator
MGRALQNRSLDRGLTILGALSMRGASSLKDLHAHTSLPKSTIRRILGTLIQRKVVRRSLSDRLYRTNVSLPLQRKQRLAQSEGWLVDCAVPHMIELTRSAGWSCDLHIFEGRKSRVIESTRPLSPFFQYERQIDLEVPVFASAAGLAVLATWKDRDVLKLVEEIGEDPVWGLQRFGMTSRQLLATLRRMRSLGYTTRVAHWRGQTPLADTLTAIAQPISRAGVAVGALAFLWPKGFLSAEQFAASHLDSLRRATKAISADLMRLDQG